MLNMFKLKNIKHMETQVVDGKIPISNSKHRKELLVRYIINDILNGATRSVLVQKITEDAYNIDYKYSVAAADKYIREARDILKEDFDEMLPTLKQDMANRTLDVYTECRELGDRFNALKALESINKMFGLYEEKVKIDANVQNVVEISFGLEESNDE
jgi:bifunctional pyridoxal-dependent enzyme with beta-cystathionase and maltose regulon repressor activities